MNKTLTADDLIALVAMTLLSGMPVQKAVKHATYMNIEVEKCADAEVLAYLRKNMPHSRLLPENRYVRKAGY